MTKTIKFALYSQQNYRELVIDKRYLPSVNHSLKVSSDQNHVLKIVIFAPINNCRFTKYGDCIKLYTLEAIRTIESYTFFSFMTNLQNGIVK